MSLARQTGLAMTNGGINAELSDHELSVLSNFIVRCRFLGNKLRPFGRQGTA
jgi:hypothetical protein